MAVNISGIDVVTNLDLVAMGANLKQPRGVVLTYEFTSDGAPLLIPIVAISDNACINGLTLENKSRPAAPVGGEHARQPGRVCRKRGRTCPGYQRFIAENLPVANRHQ